MVLVLEGEYLHVVFLSLLLPVRPLGTLHLCVYVALHIFQVTKWAEADAATKILKPALLYTPCPSNPRSRLRVPRFHRLRATPPRSSGNASALFFTIGLGPRICIRPPKPAPLTPALPHLPAPSALNMFTISPPQTRDFVFRALAQTPRSSPRLQCAATHAPRLSQPCSRTRRPQHRDGIASQGRKRHKVGSLPAGTETTGRRWCPD